MQVRPRRRAQGVVSETVDDGAVVYDTATERAHSRDGVATRVFAAADGTGTIGQIAAAPQLDEAGVWGEPSTDVLLRGGRWWGKSWRSSSPS